VRRTAKTGPVCDRTHRRIAPRRSFGLKPLSARVRRASLRFIWCVMPDSNRRPLLPKQCSTTELITQSHPDVRSPVVSPPFERRNATRRLSFTYRLPDGTKGRWLPADSLAFCAGALACKARTALHYPLPLTISDVGTAVSTTTCSLTGPHSRCHRCVSPATPAHRLAAIPAAAATRTRGVGLAWDDRVRALGGTPWVAPLCRRCRRLSTPGRLLAGTAGLEPATFRLTAGCSTTELRARSGGSGKG
jgi:hypothetical protein